MFFCSFKSGKAAWLTKLPFSSSSPMFIKPTFGLLMPYTASAKMLPKTPNWANTSGLQSALAPTSSIMPNPFFSLGTLVAMAGRCTPSMARTLNMEPTNMAPVFPAEAKESIFPSFRYWKPTEMLEFGFWVMALVGCSPILITSVQWTNSKHEASICCSAKIGSACSVSPNNTIFWSGDKTCWAAIAPKTAALGA